jgi:hypothetical protein
VDGETTARGWQAECGGEHGGARMSVREINVVGPERRGHAGVCGCGCRESMGVSVIDS